jgi:Holliday junction resolvase-like predicted endonuclease
MTKDGAEIDLIVERAGKKTLCIEIKSGDSVKDGQLRNLVNLTSDINNAKAICLYNGEDRLNYDSVEVRPWQDALMNFELVPN